MINFLQSFFFFHVFEMCQICLPTRQRSMSGRATRYVVPVLADLQTARLPSPWKSTSTRCATMKPIHKTRLIPEVRKAVLSIALVVSQFFETVNFQDCAWNTCRFPAEDDAGIFFFPTRLAKLLVLLYCSSNQ